jgi:hypothetical protein
MNPSPSYNRRDFLRVGAGIAGGSIIAAPTEGMKGPGGRSPFAMTPALNRPDTGGSPGAQAGKTLRPFGIFLANHNQDTGLRLWSLERWQREIADTRRMGSRTIWFLPFQFGQRTSEDFEDMSAHWLLQREICRAVVAAGLEVGIYLGLNDLFPKTWEEHPGWQATQGKYFLEQAQVCPSVPEARQELFRLRERLFAGLPRIDYIMTQITDYGGCGCEMCAPYPKTYLRVLEEQSALAKRYHPEVRIVAAGLSSSVADNDMLRELLPKMAWVDYVWELPRGCKPVIKAAMPETTMIGGWGKFGPCPVLADLKHVYEYDLAHVSGVAQYCEGLHDDVNRFALLRFAQDPQRSVEDVARAYAEDWLHLTGRDAVQVGEVIAGLGSAVEIAADRAWMSPAVYGADNPHADERMQTLLDVRTRVHRLEDNFRYWLLHYRAVCESLSCTSGSLSADTLRQEADTARRAFLRLEPEYGQFLARQHPSAQPGRLEWNWPRTFSAAWKREHSFT